MAGKRTNKLALLVAAVLVVVIAAVAVVLLTGDDEDDGESKLAVNDAWVKLPEVSAAMDMGDDTGDNTGDDSSDGMSGGESGDMADAEPGDDMAGDEMESGDGDGESAMAGWNTAAFMIIENSGDRDDALVSASVDPAVAEVVELHKSEMNAQGVMEMNRQDSIPVPAGGAAELKPGGLHIMLLNVDTTLAAGDMVALTLTFESGKTVTVDAPVRPLGE